MCFLSPLIRLGVLTSIWLKIYHDVKCTITYYYFNLRETLIKARVPPTNTRPSRVQNGYKKCIRPSCITCPYSITGNIIKATATDFKTEVNAPVNCYTKNIIYLISCQHCREQYVGETKRTANDRFGNHRGYVNNNKDDKATGHHFNLPGHSISDMKFQIIEKVHNKDPFFRKEREKMYINKLNTKLKGINRISWLLMLIASQKFYDYNSNCDTWISFWDSLVSKYVDYVILVPFQPDAVHIKWRNWLLNNWIINQIFWSGDFYTTLKYLLKRCICYR